jgi:mRNA interferase MazF
VTRSVRRGRYVPERGDAVWLTFDAHAGHERAGRRPAVVISPRRYNGLSGLALLCPVTSQIKGYPFEVVLPAGLPVEGAVLSDQVRSLDWGARKASRICAVPSATIEEVVGKLQTLLIQRG